MAALFALGLVPLLAIWDGYVLSVLWRWFIVPTFGAPALSISVAIGMTLIAAMLTHQTAKEDTEFERLLAAGIVGPTLFLFLGWIVKALA